MALTLTVPEILLDVIRSFTKQIPAVNRMGTDFRPDRLKLNQTYIAHVPGIPLVADYDAGNGGYRNGSQSARGLLTDLPILVNRHKHVPLKWTHLESIKDNKQRYAEVIGNAGYALAKAVIDDLLSEVKFANFSEESVIAVADSDLEAFTGVTGKMNKRGALTNGRTAIINTDVANVFGADTRVSSKDYHGQQVGGTSLRRWTNVAGFAEIFEYPDMPVNGENLTGFAFDSRAFALLAGIPDDFDPVVIAQLGIPQVMGRDVVTDPDTGITMAAVSWQEPGTGDVFWSPTIVWGKSLGRQGAANAAGALVDYAGHRIISAARA
ncbi:P22 coat protein [Opitutaceae bacterium TAV1]|nr:P22 coat protein [Opitutaceae bacterium TAV1]